MWRTILSCAPSEIDVKRTATSVVGPTPGRGGLGLPPGPSSAISSTRITSASADDGGRSERDADLELVADLDGLADRGLNPELEPAGADVAGRALARVGRRLPIGSG